MPMATKLGLYFRMNKIDECIECGKPTAFGSGLFVNRIPANNGEKDGYMCAECPARDCPFCGKAPLEYEVKKVEDNLAPFVVCLDCI